MLTRYLFNYGSHTGALIKGAPAKLLVALFLAGSLLCSLLFLTPQSIQADPADFRLYKTVASTTVTAGEIYTYTIHIENNGSSDVFGTLTETLPSNISIANVINDDSAGRQGNALVWSNVSIGYGEESTRQFSILTTKAEDLVNDDFTFVSGLDVVPGETMTVTIIADAPSQVYITPNPATVDVGDYTTIGITLADQYGNQIYQPQSVQVAAHPGYFYDNPLSHTITATTDISGLLTVEMTSTVKGTNYVTASIDGIDGYKQVEFVPGPPYTITTLATPNVLTADGSISIIQATIVDQYNNPVSTSAVTFTTSFTPSKFNNLEPPVTVDTTNGVAQVNFKSTKAGTAAITISTAAMTAVQEVLMIPGPPVHMELLAVPETITADGVSTSAMTFLVKDANFNLVVNPYTGWLTTTLGTFGNGLQVYSDTVVDGRLDFPLTAGTDTGQALVKGSVYGLFPTEKRVTFGAGPPDHVIVDIQPDVITGSVGANFVTVYASIYDVFDNLVDSSQRITLTAEAGLFDGKNKTVVFDDVDTGQVAPLLNSDGTLGERVVTATVAGVPIATDTVTYIPDVPYQIDIDYDPNLVTTTNPALVKVAQSTPVTLTVEDQWNHPLSGVSVSVTPPRGSLTPDSGTSNANGEIYATLESLESTPFGVNDNVTATGPAGDLEVNNGLIQFVPEAASKAYITVYPLEIAADGTSQSTIYITVTDQYENPVPQYQPVIQSDIGTLTGNSFTDEYGNTTRQIQAGYNLGTANITETSLLWATPGVTVAFIAGPPYTATLVTPSSSISKQVSDGDKLVTLAISVTDQYHHAVANRDVVVTATLGTMVDCDRTNSSGIINCSMYSRYIGSTDIYVEGVLVGGSDIEFIHGPLDQIRVTPYGSINDRYLIQTGEPYTFTATGYDEFDNEIKGLTFAWFFAPSSYDGDIDVDDGIFIGRDVDDVTVKATAGGETGASYVEVIAGAITQIDVSADPKSTIADNNSRIDLTIQLMDQYANPVLYDGALIDVGSDIGSVEGDSVSVDGQFQRTIRSLDTGGATLTATFQGKSLNVLGDKVVTFTAGAPSQALIQANPTDIPANGTADTQVQITIQDVNGNPVAANYPVSIAVDAGVLDSNSGTTDANGVITRTLTSVTQVHTVAFTIRYGGSPLIVSGDDIRFVVDVLDYLTVTPGATSQALVAGTAYTFTMQGYDKYDAPIPSDINYTWELQEACNNPNGTATGCGALLGTGPSPNLKTGEAIQFLGSTAGVNLRLIAAGDQLSGGGYHEEQEIIIQVLPAPPVTGVALVQPEVITVGRSGIISLTLIDAQDQFGNAARVGEPITLSVLSQPNIVYAPTAIYDNAGASEAFALLNSAKYRGVYSVTAVSNTGPLTLTGQTTVTLVPEVPDNVEILSVNPEKIIASGWHTGEMVIQVYDLYGNKVLAGHPVAFTTDLGTMLPDNTPTDIDGRIYRVLEAPLTLGTPNFIGVDEVVNGVIPEFVPGPPARADVSMNTTDLVAGDNLNSYRATFTIYDNWNHLVANNSIITPTLTPDLADFLDQPRTVNGEDTVSLRPGTKSGVTTMSAGDVTLNGDTTIIVRAADPAIALVHADPLTHVVGYTSTSTVVVTITDRYSNVVPLEPFTMSSVLPGVIEGTGATLIKNTNNNGSFASSISSTVSGIETFHFVGAAGELSLHPDSDTIAYEPGPPVDVTIDPAGPLTTRAGIPITVSVSSRDGFGNPVDDWPGREVTYSWWQSSTVQGQTGYGKRTALDARERYINFEPVDLGQNRLYATGGISPSPILALNTIPGLPYSTTVSADPPEVLADGKTPFTVTFIAIHDVYSHTILDGIPLTITLDTSPPMSATTLSQGGMATATFTSTKVAGTYGFGLQGEGQTVLNIFGDESEVFLPGDPKIAEIEAIPTSILADGVSTSQLYVTVRDVNYNRIADGIPITVTTTAGTVLNNGTTTVNGVVMPQLQSTRMLSIAKLSVAGPDADLFTSGDDVEFVVGPPAAIWVDAEPEKVLADGVATSTITLTIQDDYEHNLDVSGSAALTTARGTAELLLPGFIGGVEHAVFTTDTSIGMVDLIAFLDGMTMTTKGDELEQVPGPPVSATIISSDYSLQIDVDTTDVAYLTAQLWDAGGRPIEDDTVITLTTGVGTLDVITATSIAGKAYWTMRPGMVAGWTEFMLTVATRWGILEMDPIGNEVEIKPGPIVEVIAEPLGPHTMTAGDTLNLDAFARDVFGNVITLTIQDYYWEKDFYDFGDGPITRDGQFTAMVAGRVHIRAKMDIPPNKQIFSDPPVIIDVLPGPVATATVYANPEAIPIGGATSAVVIEARDAYGIYVTATNSYRGNLVSNGTSLSVKTDLGTLSGSGTTIDGRITRTLKSGVYYGYANLTVNDIVPIDPTVRFLPRAWIEPMTYTLFADGVSETKLRISMYDINFRPVPDGTNPTITTTLGTVIGNTGTQDGVMTRTFRSTTTIGSVEFYVNAFKGCIIEEGNEDSCVEMNLVPDIPSVVRIDANPDILVADDSQSTLLRLTLEDRFGHVVTNAGFIPITPTLGTLSDWYRVQDGITTRILTASNTPGRVTFDVAPGFTTTGDDEVYFAGVISDTDFTGDLNDWYTSQWMQDPASTLPAYTTTLVDEMAVGGIVVEPLKGDQVLHLGATTYGNDNHAVSYTSIRRPIYVEPDIKTYLYLWYRILSFDVAVGAPENGSQEWDPFKIYVDGNQVMRGGVVYSDEWNEWYEASPETPQDLGWQQVFINLTPYAGDVVWLEFRQSNNIAPVDNTWTFLDQMDTVRIAATIYVPFLINGD